MKTAMRVLAGLLVLMLVIFAVTAWLALRHPADTILPGVHVQTIDVSGLTVDEAVAALTRGLPAPETAGVDVRVAGQTWRVTWAEVGQR